MEETKLQHSNSFKVVGRLIKADIKTGTSAKNGQEYVSVTATVISKIGGADKEFEIDFYSSALTGAGKPSSLYASYTKMNELEGKKVEITGSIRENRYFSKTLNQMVSAQELAGRFVKGVAESATDEGKWELSGFIATALTEKKNKQEEIYRYDLKLAQANYSGSAISMFVVHVNPAQREIINAVNNYEVGQTLSLHGVLDFEVKQVVAESKNEGGFGEAQVKTYTNRTKNFYITGGSGVITDETKYDTPTISELISGYKARDVELAEKSKSSGSSAVETAVPVSKKQTSLI